MYQFFFEFLLVAPEIKGYPDMFNDLFDLFHHGNSLKGTSTGSPLYLVQKTRVSSIEFPLVPFNPLNIISIGSQPMFIG